MATPGARLLMERRRMYGPQPPEEIDEHVLLPPGMKAADVRTTLDNMKLRESDIILVTYPKSGTTWMRQTIKLIRNNGDESGVDVDTAFPWIEMLTVDQVESMPSPRILKSHLPYTSMPGRNPADSPAKYIYVYRNPKDAAVSLYYHSKSLHSKSSLSWDDFYESYCVQGKVLYGHIVDHHVGWWKHRGSSNIHIENYETMKFDISAVVKRVSSFLGYNFSQEIISKISDQLQFSKMKENEATNFSWMKDYHEEGATPFLRKGIVGDWRNHFSAEQSTKMDEIVALKTKDADGLVYSYGDSS